MTSNFLTHFWVLIRKHKGNSIRGPTEGKAMKSKESLGHNKVKYFLKTTSGDSVREIVQHHVRNLMGMRLKFSSKKLLKKLCELFWEKILFCGIFLTWKFSQVKNNSFWLIIWIVSDGKQNVNRLMMNSSMAYEREALLRSCLRRSWILRALTQRNVVCNSRSNK